VKNIEKTWEKTTLLYTLKAPAAWKKQYLTSETKRLEKIKMYA